jgi:hypothetical protein
MSSFEKLRALTEQIATHEINRKQNLKKLKTLFVTLDIGRKHPEFDTIFAYKAMNLSGISLEKETLLEPKPKRYVQIIAITYEDDRGVKRAKNKNLCYFGRSEHLSDELKKEIVEFIFRWRYEKSFHNVEYYAQMIQALEG